MKKNVSVLGETYCLHLQGRVGCIRFLINIRMSVPGNTGNVVKYSIVAPSLTILAMETTMHSVCVVELHVTVNHIIY